MLLPSLLCPLSRVENEHLTGRLSATVRSAVGLATAALAALPLLAGLLLQVWSYPALFALTAEFAGLGAVWPRKL